MRELIVYFHRELAIWVHQHPIRPLTLMFILTVLIGITAALLLAAILMG